MEEGNMGIEETKIGEKCEIFPVLGGLDVKVCGEITEMNFLEQVAAEGGEVENHVTAESEIMEEAVPVAEVDVSHVAGEHVLEITEEQVCERVDDVNVGKDVTVSGDALLFPEWQVEAGGDEISVDQRVGEKEEEDVTPVFDSKVEPVVTDLAESVSRHESQSSGSGNDSDGKMSGEKFKEPVRLEVDSLTLENDTDLLVVNCLGVETAEKSSDADEEKVSSWITEDTPIIEVKTGMELITEMSHDVVNARENLVHELGDMGYAGVDTRDEVAEGKEVTAAENMIYETKMVEVENTGVEDEKDFKLDEHAIVVENRDEAVVAHEDLAAEDCIIETVEELDSDVTRDDVAEVHMEDAEVKTGIAVDVVADESSREDTKFEAKTTCSSTGDPCEGMDDSSAVGLDEHNDTPSAEEGIRTQDTEMETETVVVEPGKAFGGKRKRGKVSKSPSNPKHTGRASSVKTVEEDVCFICFDGGELVLCDRRGCPKAYHPTCVNRDEAFFRSKGRWNCGWHMCSICEKNALFMCYTCTFSLCKKCSKDAVILCVRGNKGFCETCMKTVMLIENNQQGNNDALTSFDDKGSWEFLFKDYYTNLKSKLSLSPVEVAEAKNPWKGKDMLSGPGKQESSDAQADDIDEGSGSEESVENLKTVKSKRKKKEKKSKSLTKEKDLVRAGGVSGGEGLSANSEWASKELLEFVAHMKNRDTSVLSQFDVQGLLLEYIKRNKLRDPRRKSQIICDARLQVLFGKPRVGHFEMLKLLESHFLIREEQNDDVEGSIVDTENNQLDTAGSTDHVTKGVRDRKHKTRKKGGIRGPQSNLDDYAAIDMHNISLIYLRRKLMEDLLEDVEKFHDKVIGMFVRIRISGSNQKQDMYRLVQVIGISNAAEPYKIGKKTTNIVLEILNLDKTEVTSIDTISNQDFTEEECKRLRQSIKCGLISRLTVGEILDKTMEIQEARVNDWLESETLRLSHLRDRASDLGRRKELRECVEKLQVLKTPEERHRKLKEIPEINADPKMDPNFESDENDHEAEDSRRDDFLRSKGSSFSRRERGLISPGSDSSARGGTGKVSSKDRELSRNMSGYTSSGNATHSGEMVNENSWNIEGRKDGQDYKYFDNRSSNSESADRVNCNVTRSESLTGVSSVNSEASLPVRITETLTTINETEKMWRYQDPSGKVQGPFSMVQLRKWSNTGYFPTDLKVWKTTDKQEDSILMADALAGKFEKEKTVVDNIFPSADTLHTLPISASHFDRISGTSLLHIKNRTTVDQSHVSHTKLSSEKWIGNDITNLPSPTPKQSNTGWTGGESGVISANSSPSVADASVLNSIVQTSTAFSPPPNSQQGFQVGSVNSLGFQSTTTSEPHAIQMHGHQSTMIHQVVGPSPLTESQVMGGSSQSQPLNYGWAVPNMQNYVANFSNLNTNAAAQPQYQRSAHSLQPNMYTPAVPDATNTGWGTQHANASMGWVNPAPGNTNMYRGPPIQPTVDTNSGWVAPTGNAGANIPGPVQALGPGWVTPPVQGSIPGNGWGPPSANSGAPAPVQGSTQGNTNQGWGATPHGNQGVWVGQQKYGSSQFSGHHNDQGRDPGFGGSRPWNKQSSFGGGGPRGSFNRQDMVCPYYTSGRCRKGAHCDLRHN